MGSRKSRPKSGMHGNLGGSQPSANDLACSLVALAGEEVTLLNHRFGLSCDV